MPKNKTTIDKKKVVKIPKEHKKHHSKAHIKLMEKKMKEGKSFKQAHNIAVKKDKKKDKKKCKKYKKIKCPIINNIQTIPDDTGLTPISPNAKNCFLYPSMKCRPKMGVQLNCKCRYPNNINLKYAGLCAKCYN